MKEKPLLRIVATISDAGAAVYVGGLAESTSEIIEIPTKSIPPNLKRFLNEQREAKARNRCTYRTIAFSLLEDTGE